MTTEVSATSEGQLHLIKTNSSKNYAAIRQKLTKAGLNLADAQQSSFNQSNLNQNQTPSKNRKKNKFKVRTPF